MVNNKKLLDEQIKMEIESLCLMETGSEEKEKEVENLAKLYKLRIEEDKNERENENVQKRDFIDKVKIGVEVGLGALNLFITCYWMHKTFKFEETGSITSSAGRGMFNKVLKMIK
jgi:hypothetical protein